MNRVVVSPEARNDLLEIIAYISLFAGSATAERWDRRLWKVIEDLAEFPAIGALRPALGDQTRILVVQPYVLIYEHAVGTNIVQVLRVVHGRRNIARRLLKSLR
jgi:plasmid stabilization system protein ParE